MLECSAVHMTRYATLKERTHFDIILMIKMNYQYRLCIAFCVQIDQMNKMSKKERTTKWHNHENLINISLSPLPFVDEKTY